MTNKVFLVFSTCPDEALARRLAGAVVTEKLAACVNLQVGVTSIYRWDGETREDSECLLIMKTVDNRLEALIDRVRALHSCELPEIVAVPVSAGLPGYLQWVADECRQPTSPP